MLDDLASAKVLDDSDWAKVLGVLASAAVRNMLIALRKRARAVLKAGMVLHLQRCKGEFTNTVAIAYAVMGLRPFTKVDNA